MVRVMVGVMVRVAGQNLKDMRCGVTGTLKIKLKTDTNKFPLYSDSSPSYLKYYLGLINFLQLLFTMNVGSASDGAKAVSESHPDSFKEFDKENAERSGTNKENTKGRMRPWTIDDFEIGLN